MNQSQLNQIEASELAALIQLYLLQQSQQDSSDLSTPQKWVTADPETYRYFKSLEKKEKKSSTTPSRAPIPQTTKPTVLPIPSIPPSPPSIQFNPPPPSPPPPTIHPTPSLNEGNQTVPVRKQEQAETARLPSSLQPKWIDLQDVNKFFVEKHPHYPLLDEFPQSKDKLIDISKIPSEIKSGVLLLYKSPFSASEETFISNISRAISLESQEEKRAITLSFSSISEEDREKLLNNKEIQLFLLFGEKETPLEWRSCLKEEGDGKYRLGLAPCLLLEKPLFYLQQPTAKATLWQMMRAFLTKRCQRKWAESKSLFSI